jgi:RecT family
MPAMTETLEPHLTAEPIPDDERELRGIELAERAFPPERRKPIAAFLEIPPDDPALLPYLAWCASLKLSPTSGHVWLIPRKIKAHDGQPEKTIWKPAIGRDGLLHKARLTKGSAGGYRGMQFGVVAEHDVFEVEYVGQLESDPVVVHKFASKPTEFAKDVSPDRYRGRTIGAWAKAYIDGEPPCFYFASIREHGKQQQAWDYDLSTRTRKRLFLDGDGKTTFEPTGRPKMEWSGAWEYTSAMVLKAAQSYVLRIGLGVTGVVPVDELSDPRAYSSGTDESEPHGIVVPEAPAEIDFGDDPILAERLRDALDEANRLQPGTYLPQKVRLLLAASSPSEVLKGVEAWIETRAPTGDAA